MLARRKAQSLGENRTWRLVRNLRISCYRGEKTIANIHCGVYQSILLANLFIHVCGFPDSARLRRIVNLDKPEPWTKSTRPLVIIEQRPIHEPPHISAALDCRMHAADSARMYPALMRSRASATPASLTYTGFP